MSDGVLILLLFLFALLILISFLAYNYHMHKLGYERETIIHKREDLIVRDVWRKRRQ